MNEIFLRFWKFFGAVNFEFTKTPRESFLAAYDCCLAHPTPSHTPSGTSLNLGGCSCFWGAVAVRKVKCKRSVEGCFFVSFCVLPQKIGKVRPPQRLKAEV